MTGRDHRSLPRLARLAAGALMLAGLGLAAHPASAQPLTPTITYTVTTTADDPGTTTTCPATVKTLRDAIDCADTDVSGTDIILIKVPAGHYLLKYGTLDLNSQGGQIYVQGAGASTTIVDGSGNGATSGLSVFEFDENDPAWLTGVTVTGGSGYEGGGVYVYDTEGLVMSSDVITGNNADATQDGYGGGLYVYSDGGGSGVTLSTVTITKNGAYEGGGIYVQNDAYSEYAYPQVITGTNVTVTHNMACEYGYLFSTTLAPWDPGNFCEYYGQGGGMDDEYSPASFTNSTFSYNTAGNPAADYGEGGGIFMNSDDGYGDTLRLTTVNIAWNNGGEYGGGIYNYYGVISGNGVNITNNYALDYGGGVYNYEYTYSSFTLQGSSEVGWNSVGGAYYCTKNAAGTTGTCTTAAQAGTINQCPTGPLVVNCDYSGGDGGGIYSEEYGDTSLAFGRIDHNVAVTNINFMGYSDASLKGSGLKKAGTTVTPALSPRPLFGYGGGVYNYYGTLALAHEVVYANQAYEGGGLYNYSVYATNIASSQFVGNRAVTSGGVGGAIYNYYFMLSIQDTQITNNYAGFETGGVYNDTGVIQETGSSAIQGNIAPGNCKNTWNPCT